MWEGEICGGPPSTCGGPPSICGGPPLMFVRPPMCGGGGLEGAELTELLTPLLLLPISP